MSQSLTQKGVRSGINDIRRRVAIITSLLLQDGVSERCHRQLQILYAELGDMPELSVVQIEGKFFLEGMED